MVGSSIGISVRTMSKTDEESDNGIVSMDRYDELELGENGKSKRITQILESRQDAQQAVFDPTMSNEKKYAFVCKYLSEFLHMDYERFNKKVVMAEIEYRHIAPQLPPEISDRNPEPANPDRFPIAILGAIRFIHARNLTVEIEVDQDGMGSGRETKTYPLTMPADASQSAYEAAEALRKNIGLEIKNNSLPKDNI